MSSIWLIWRGLTFHARSHLGALLGAAVGSAVLIGALVVGDSVRESLRQIALARLGGVDVALSSNDRLFRVELAEDLARELQRGSGVDSGAPGAAGSEAGRPAPRGSALSRAVVAPALQLPGTAASSDGSARANRVQVLGVDERFWELAREKPASGMMPADSVALNEPLAEHLGVEPGDTIILRLQKPSELSRDAPLSPEENFSVALRVRVQAVLSEAEFGRFSLEANQVAPFNAYLPLALMQQRAEAVGKANLLLAGREFRARLDDGERLDAVVVNQALHRVWRLGDAQLELLELERGGLELRSARVFLDPPVVEAGLRIEANDRTVGENGISPAGQSEVHAGEGILTYLVNELRAGDRATPYSMVTAMGAPVVPADMGDDEILISEWLAEDLQARQGDELALTYFVVGKMRKPEERTALFRVRDILPMQPPAADRSLMPDFPGLTDAESCRDWDTGFPIDMDRIRPKDETYWNEHRGTPKAFVTLAAGQRMWSNRFGDLTAIRYSGVPAETVAEGIRRSLDPSSVGLVFQPSRAQALAASEQSQDFGGLFLGFSFFLIVAALLLVALLFQFGVEQRSAELGTLLALGIPPKQVRRWLLFEGGALAVLGGLLGLAGGIGYAKAMLHALSTVWRDAIGTTTLQFHAQPLTLVLGTLAGIGVALLTIWLAVRKQARQPARELLAEGAVERSAKVESGSASRRSGQLAAAAALLAGGLLGYGLVRPGGADAGLFFGAGALLLIGGLALSSVLLGKAESSKTASRISLLGMGVRNATRRRKRSLATLGLLACGSFLVASIGVFRLDALADAEERSSGTGGFAFIGESTLPVVHDLNTEAGREPYGLYGGNLDDVRVVPFRVRDGEDASCLNLNRAQTPRLLGVDPELLAERGAFTFVQVASGLSRENPWALLDRQEDGIVPAIGDAASIKWAMGKNVGDILIFVDERGREFQVRLVAAVGNSILQGNLLISEEQFVRRFPTESGYRMFLIDAPSAGMERTSATLSRALQDFGLELTPATRRLAAFNAVQNTYLNTFQVLGGLGLLLGSVGLGVVVLRNVLERRGELALLKAVGFRSRSVKWLVISEHGALLTLGLGVGVLAGAAAVLPEVLAPGANIPYASLAVTLGAVFLSGAIWTWAAASLALRGKLLDALRNS